MFLGVAKNAFGFSLTSSTIRKLLTLSVVE